MAEWRLPHPTQLAPAGDRFVGIAFALVVMWFVFDRIWPVRTVTAMRRVLASVLQSGANLFQLVDNTKQHDQLQRAIDGVRDRVGKNISALRTMSEAVVYEFGIDREQHIRSSEVILQSSLTAAALIWKQAVLHDREKLEFLAEPGLVEMRRKLGKRLDILAGAVVRETPSARRIFGILRQPASARKRSLRRILRNTIAVFHHV